MYVNGLRNQQKKVEHAKPFLKWAGGKTQLLDALSKYVPPTYGQYIEPFIGGGALFFELQPDKAVLADINDELINCYSVVRDNVHALLELLRHFVNEEGFYYEMRALKPGALSNVERAARLIYLNKTCFNGLYRVNKDGYFNVPFGKRTNPTICDKPTLLAASEVLQGVELVYGHYQEVLRTYAQPGDFVFLDPPYHPSGGFSDFKRYNKEFFYENDHIALRDEFIRLAAQGTSGLLTNSNTTFVRELYEDFEYEIVDTRRNISSDATTRTSEDIIVIARPPDKTRSSFGIPEEKLIHNFPGTRYMGSKYRVLPFIARCVSDLNFNSVLDAFAGSGCVSYMFKQYGKQVISNDLLHFTYHFANALIENSCAQLDHNDVTLLLQPNVATTPFISETFKDLYFSDAENAFLDLVRANIEELAKPYKKSLALAALARACMKRRPRGIFTYTGDRYDDGRRDLQMDLREHFLENIAAFNTAVFDNGQENCSYCGDVFDLDVKADLVYLDPPYFSSRSDSDYTRRYHFVEGLVRQWQGVEIQQHTKTKKIESYYTPFNSRDKVYDAFERLFEKFHDSIMVVSYSSNSIPTKTELVDMLKRHKRTVRVHQVEHLYSFGNQAHRIGDNANRALEYVFVAY